MRAADDRAVIERNLSVAIHIAELDATRRRTVLAVGGAFPGRGICDVRSRVGGVTEISVGDVAVECADRLADLIDDLVAESRRDRSEEEVLITADGKDLIGVVAAVEAEAPRRRLMADGEIDARIAHLADVDDRRRGYTSRQRNCWIE